MRLKTRSTMFRPVRASLSRSHGAARFPLGGAPEAMPEDRLKAAVQATALTA
ncbi:hypothetical protein [Bifidobacterium sp. WCA-178-WT-4B]|uniref:hypothetical protein n=1 Tax=Bifidobacterium sp. WCA-178-WT-4B TaxID=2605776 RepID=UPI001E44643A|nr:hypothetical protein [Bifidobacterium sp. WCA-178-WT-4B]